MHSLRLTLPTLPSQSSVSAYLQVTNLCGGPSRPCSMLSQNFTLASYQTEGCYVHRGA